MDDQGYLYDRHWGFIEDNPEVIFEYFEDQLKCTDYLYPALKNIIEKFIETYNKYHRV